MTVNMNSECLSRAFLTTSPVCSVPSLITSDFLAVDFVVEFVVDMIADMDYLFTPTDIYIHEYTTAGTMSFADLLDDDDYKPAGSSSLADKADNSGASSSDFPFFDNPSAADSSDLVEQGVSEVERSMPMAAPETEVAHDGSDELGNLDEPVKKPKATRAKKAATASSSAKKIPSGTSVCDAQEDQLIAGRWTRQVAIRKINEARIIPSMQEKLAEVMKLPTPLQLIKKSDAELGDIIAEMELHMAAKNGLGEMVKSHVIPKALDGYELILTKLGVPAKGVAALLMTSPEFKADIDELVWKRVSYTNWPVEFRLLICIAGSTVAMVTANMKARAFQAGIDLSGINEQFADL